MTSYVFSKTNDFVVTPVILSELQNDVNISAINSATLQYIDEVGDNIIFYFTGALSLPDQAILDNLCLSYTNDPRPTASGSGTGDLVVAGGASIGSNLWIGGNFTGTNLSTSGTVLNFPSFTYTTDTISPTDINIVSIGQITIASSTASNVVANAASFYIQSAPVLGANVSSITNPYAMYVAAGKTYIGGSLQIPSGAVNGYVLTSDAVGNASWGTFVASFGGFADGSVSTPGAYFTSETNTGFYRPNTGQIAVTLLGTNIATFSSTGLNLITGSTLNVGSSGTTSPLNVFGQITASNGFTLTTGALNITSTSGAISLTGTSFTTNTAMFITATTNQLRFGVTNTVTLTSPAPAASRTYTIPDAGGAATFIMSTFGSAQTIAGGLISSETLTASNGFTLTTGALNITSTSGAISLTGTSFTTNTALSITSTTQSTSSTSGALIVSGGLGIAKDIWLGSSFTDSIYTLNSINGILFNIPSVTTTDNAIATGTTSNINVVTIGQTTLSTLSNSITATEAASLYISNAPAAGSNVVITNPYALKINAGKTYIGDALQIPTGAVANYVLSSDASGNATWAPPTIPYTQVIANASIATTLNSLQNIPLMVLTPAVAGSYVITFTSNYRVSNANRTATFDLALNGVSVANTLTAITVVTANQDAVIIVSALITFNGTTDTVTARYQISANTLTLQDYRRMEALRIGG